MPPPMQLPVDPALYGAFLATMAVMAVTPGPANLFSIANGLRRGRGAVIQGVLGMSAATLVWFVGAALGLSALVEAFPQAVRAISLLGAAYVAWLGLSAILSGVRNEAEPPPPPTHLERSAFRDGFMVQLSNPKALLFFVGVLPPYLDHDRPLAAQFLLFAVATVGMDFITMTSYGLGGAALAARMSQPRFRRAYRFAIGGLLVIVAVLIATRH